jgi:hypothetical protein
VSSVAQSNRQLRVQFFDYLFGDKVNGYLCIATAHKDKSGFKENWFYWPTERQTISGFVDSVAHTHNVWFCVNLLDKEKRIKENALPSTFAWADLDEVDPAEVMPTPTCVLESSEGRYQAFWRIGGDPIPAAIAEDYSRRLAYSTGADKSGWDITQLLRVPWTLNFKYDPPVQVKLLAILNDTYDATEFDKITPVLDTDTDIVSSEQQYPQQENLPGLDETLAHYKALGRIDGEFAKLYSIAPDSNADWSRILWRFINKCFTMGMTEDEIYVVTGSAACNKYTRDNRPATYLWRDIKKAGQEHKQYEILVTGKVEIIKMPHLVDFDEFEEDTFIKDYKTWANNATDAPEQYHELACFIALSSVICSGLFLAVHWGEIVPNIWGLVLGESTLTRKTTAMRLAVDMLKSIDDNIILATDGSAEGLLTGLSTRPKRVSVFWKDEVSGLFDSINRKDYLAGLPETLTQLYDAPKVLTRLLRKETITISEPYFIFFGGGIRDKVYSLLNDEYILSGFLPRFLVVSGENDLARLRRTGPPTVQSTERKDNVIRSLADLRERYIVQSIKTQIAGQEVDIPGPRVEAKLSDAAWSFYNEIEDKLTNAGTDSDISMLALPTLSRLSFSLLKMSLLIAASRRLPNSAGYLEVEVTDVKQAAFYIEKWGHYSIDLLMNAGRSMTERMVEKAMASLRRKNGMTKAEFMQRHHLNAREAKDLIETLYQRGLINVQKHGRGERLYIV